MPAQQPTVTDVPRPPRRVAVLLASLVALVLSLSGCGRGESGQLNFQVTGGSEGRVGDITVSDAVFHYQGQFQGGVVYRPGETVSVRATIVNEGDVPDRLVSLSSSIAGGGAIDGDGTIAGHSALAAGYPKPVAAITLPDTRSTDLRLTELNTPIRAGLTYPVLLTFARAGQVRLQLRVDDPDQPRPDCPLPPNGRAPQVFTAPLAEAPIPPTSPPPDCSSLK